jgi:hypothetical protein
MELGVDIVGTSSVAELNGMKITKGNVAIKLKPIDGEQIDEATKRADEVEVLNLNFERGLGSDSTGTFVATMDLAYEKAGQPSEASGTITVSRIKDGDQHVHDVLMSMGTKGETPSYTRELIVRDNKADAMKFEFLDIMNVGTSNETRNASIIDLKAGTQCKGTSIADAPKKEETAVPESEQPSTIVTTTPSKSPSQTPVQGKLSVTQMKQ